MKVKVSDSLDNVTNINVVTTGDRPTKLLELIEWLFATKNRYFVIIIFFTKQNISSFFQDL